MTSRRRSAPARASLLLLLPLLVGGAARRVRAQAVMGRVVDEATHRPLGGVPVRLEHAASVADTLAAAAAAARLVAATDSGAALTATTTAVDGTFTLVAPGPGTYRVRFGAVAWGPWMTLASPDTADQHEYPLRLAPAYVELEVERPVVVRHLVTPQYPVGLRNSGLGGEVLLQFIVDTTGRAEPETMKALRWTNEQLVPAARAAALASRYWPAQLEGRKVRQLVQQPYTFQVQVRPRDVQREEPPFRRPATVPVYAPPR